MQTIYQEKARAIQKANDDFINDCLVKMLKIIETYKGSKLEFGNTILLVIDRTIYISVNNISVNKEMYIKLYGEDGYNTAEDIAHWLDIVEDVDKCYKAGNTKYSILWNK